MPELISVRATPSPAAEPEPAAALRPLCVDLDGSLVKSDTLVDSLLALVRTHPALAFSLPGKLFEGKAAFKAFVTASVTLDAAHLPYNGVLRYTSTGVNHGTCTLTCHDGNGKNQSHNAQSY